MYPLLTLKVDTAYAFYLVRTVLGRCVGIISVTPDCVYASFAHSQVSKMPSSLLSLQKARVRIAEMSERIFIMWPMVAT